MAKATYIQNGSNINYTNGGASDIAAGDVVGLGTRIGIAAAAIPVGALGTVITEGVFEAPAISTAAFALGDQVYWDATAEKLTNVSEGNTLAGWCIAAKAESGATARIKLLG